MALATVEDVATYMRRDLDAEDSATASQALDGISVAIKNYTNQNLELVTDDVVTLRYPGRWYFYPSRFLTLPERPIVSVTTVVNDDTTITDYEIWDEGNLWRENGWGDVVVVTYTHGYATIPEDIQVVCSEAAKRAIENPAGLNREDLNTASQWFGFVEQNERMLDRYKAMVLA